MPDSKREKAEAKRGYHHGNLRETLLVATRQMLEEEGPDSISLRAVARRAGVSQTAPYRHFQSKEDLLASVATRGYEEFGAAQQSALESTDNTKTATLDMGVAYVRFAVENPALFQLMFGPHIGDQEKYPELTAAAMRSYEPIRQGMGDDASGTGGSKGEGELHALAAWTMVHGLAELMIAGRIDPGQPPFNDRDALTRAILSYLEGPASA